MKYLFLDLASRDALVACCDDVSTVASADSSNRIRDHELVPMVETILQKAGWTFNDLDRLACVIGPGGFTSLRVAVTFINVLADQLNIPSAGIHLCDLYGDRVGVGSKEDVLWVHSTKKDQLFVCGGQWKEPTLISVDAMPHGAWMGELIDAHREQIGSDPIMLQPVADVLPLFLAQQTYDEAQLAPWYGRGW